MNTVTKAFVQLHKKEDLRALALKTPPAGVDLKQALTQIQGYQIAVKKMPTWAEVDGLIYPKHLSLEQCSSEHTALYKRSLMSGDTFVDLTGGMGVDFSTISSRFLSAVYVEQQEELCRLAAHNFPLLCPSHSSIKIVHNNGLDYLEKMSPVDAILIDPARRDGRGGKVFAISDCEPNVMAIEDQLIEKGKQVFIKLSPMLDISTILRSFRHIAEIHVLSVKNECKEVLAVLKKEKTTDMAHTTIKCVDLDTVFEVEEFSFSFAEEENASLVPAMELGNYLYEPCVSILKAGAYKLLTIFYGVKKLHQHSHLYTSSDSRRFPGRVFRIITVQPYNKDGVKRIAEQYPKANLSSRNFPLKAEELKKKLKIKDGGEVYIFATTLATGEKVLIVCEKV